VEERLLLHDEESIGTGNGKEATLIFNGEVMMNQKPQSIPL
jgi:hypothetical protein